MVSLHQPIYDWTKVERISGIVESTEKVDPVKGIYSMVQLMVKGEEKTVTAQLAPEWYINESGMKLEVGDTVEVKGCRTLLDGRPVIVAAEVRKGNSTLVLRSDFGAPTWSDWGLRR